MKNSRSVIVLAALALFAFSAQVRAQQSYEIVFDQAAYDVVVGSTVDLNVLLRETVTGGATARLAAGDNDGLFSFSFNADFSAAVGGAGSTVASDSDAMINAIFDDAPFNDSTLIGSSIDVTGATTNLTDGIEVAETSPGVYEVQLATLTVQAGDEGSVTTFDLLDHIGNGDTVFIDGFVADNDLTYGQANVTVVPIPEPASAIALLGVAGIGLIRRRRYS